MALSFLNHMLMQASGRQPRPAGRRAESEVAAANTDSGNEQAEAPSLLLAAREDVAAIVRDHAAAQATTTETESAALGHD